MVSTMIAVVAAAARPTRSARVRTKLKQTLSGGAAGTFGSNTGAAQIPAPVIAAAAVTNAPTMTARNVTPSASDRRVRWPSEPAVVANPGLRPFERVRRDEGLDRDRVCLLRETLGVQR
jgi:hypothetical protein